MEERPTIRRSERGAILIQTAVSILMLMGFTVFVCDYGVVLVSRGQAQNAADAGALAGAISMMFDIADPGDPTQLDATAKPIAIATARQNVIWNQAGEVTVGFPLCQQGGGDQDAYCIQVNVYRNGEHGSTPLPVFFGPVLGITWQGVGASAMAQAASANGTTCLRSFAIPDRFVGSADDTFDSPPDIYTAPDGDNPGTGYTVPDYFGTELILKQVPDGGTQVGPGWFRLLDLASGGGGDDRQTTRACGSQIFGIGDALTGRLNPGVDSAVVRAAAEDLIALDPLAVWDSAARRIRSSCVETRSCSQYDGRGIGTVADPGATASPRLITLPIFNPRRLALNGVVRIVNFVGFFIIETRDGPSGPEIRGMMLTKAGLLRSDKDPINEHSAFLKTVQLVR